MRLLYEKSKVILYRIRVISLGCMWEIVMFSVEDRKKLNNIIRFICCCLNWFF